MSHYAACTVCEFRSDPIDARDITDHLAHSPGHTVEEVHLDDDLGPPFDSPQIRTGDDGRPVDEAGHEYRVVATVTGELDFVSAPQCPLPAVGAWRWYPTEGQRSDLPGVTFCRLHEDAAKSLAEREQPSGHGLSRDHYADGQDRVSCGVPGLPAAEADAARIAALVDEARSVLARLSGLTANVRGVVQAVGNEDAVLEALVGLAVDVAVEVDVVRSRIETRLREKTS